ncbi:phosphomannomutase [Neokomagataea thailandica]|uniref:Phosphoglucosamine mutase n=1 Tax=Neokomagataea tanensis NBRC 106556 TaxID=1223519 RepID=A0ABQ0QIU8_9PROT|nr:MULTISPECIES: phosphomannomutase [Neokomagataea]GBR46389.1 phosphoglucosamine mutase [Neokomagataea tanensis NBRC 106556]
MNIASWMERSGVAFGTSGARGLVAAMTDEICWVYTQAFLRYLRAIGQFERGTPVAVAGDLRPSTPRIIAACIAAIRAEGGVPVYGGTVPTPALCTYAFARRMPSLMVTGSHIPADRNGIKFNRIDGEFLKGDEAAMREVVVTVPDGLFDQDGSLCRAEVLPPVTDMVEGYVVRYRNAFGQEALKGQTLGVYQHSSVGRDVLPLILKALGADVVPLGRSESFVSVDTEAVRPEDTILAVEWAKSGRFQAILTMDGDADRPLLADEYGQWLRGDVLGILCARFLKAAHVVTPVSSNTALEKSAFAVETYRTRIGSPYVISAMQDAVAAVNTKAGPVVGYEANGGFLLQTEVVLQAGVLSALPTRDAVLPMLAALCAAAERHRPLSALCAELPSRFTASDRLKEMPTAQSCAAIEGLVKETAAGAKKLGFTALCGDVMHVDMTDGLRMTFVSQEIIHVRPSGNAPELRVYVEAATQERAVRVLESALRAVSVWREAA